MKNFVDKTVLLAAVEYMTGGDLVPINTNKLGLLWKRLEDTKLQLDLCHNDLKELRADKLFGALPEADGNLAHKNALRVEELAVSRYVQALNDFKAALALESAPTSIQEPLQETNGTADITPREREVLVLIASGKSSKEIAAELGIAFRTAVCHRYRLSTKLKAHKTADLTKAALRMGLIKL